MSEMSRVAVTPGTDASGVPTGSSPTAPARARSGGGVAPGGPVLAAVLDAASERDRLAPGVALHRKSRSGGRASSTTHEARATLGPVAQKEGQVQPVTSQSEGAPERDYGTPSDPRPSRWRPPFLDNDARGVPTTRETVTVKGGVL